MSRGLSDQQRAALTEASDHRWVSIDHLADLCGITRQAAHKMVDGLRDRGLVWTSVVGWHDGDRPQRQMVVMLGDPGPGETFLAIHGQPTYTVTRHGKRVWDGKPLSWLSDRPYQSV